MADAEQTVRVSARTLLVDQDDRILLLRFRFDEYDATDAGSGYIWCLAGTGRAGTAAPHH